MSGSTGRPSGPSINIKVKTMAPATHELCVAQQATIGEVKQELQEITNIPVDRQRLIYHGRVMHDEQTLSELGSGASSHTAAGPNVRGGTPTAGMPGDMPGFPIDIGPLMQNLFSSLVGPAGGAAGAPGPGQLAPQHLLYALDAYLTRLQQSQPPVDPMRVMSLDPYMMPEMNRQFIQGIQSVLSAVDLPLPLQQLMRELPTSTSTAPAQGASLQQPAAPPASQQHLALAAVGRLLQRSSLYLHNLVEPGLESAAQQLADTSRMDNSALRDLGDSLGRTAGVLHGAAALMVELARVASAAMMATEGNLVPLMANTPTVLAMSNNEPPSPAFPSLYPQVTWVNPNFQQPTAGSRQGAGSTGAASGAHAAAAARAGGAAGSDAGGGLSAMIGSMLGSMPAQVAMGPTTSWTATTPDGRTATGRAGSMTVGIAMPAGEAPVGINHPMGPAGGLGGSMPAAMRFASTADGTPPGMSEVEASLAWQIATAVMAALGPVVQSAADGAVVRVRQAREQIRQQQATEHAQVVSRVVGESLARVLETAGSALQSGLNRIEAGLQEVEQAQGHEASLMDIARVLQSTFAPQMAPLVESLDRAGRQAQAAAAAARAASASAQQAARAAQQAHSASNQAAAAASTSGGAGAAGAPPSSQPSSSAAAAAAAGAGGASGSAPAAGSSAPGGAGAGPSSSSGGAGGEAGPRGLGGLSKGPSLPSKRKAPAPVNTGRGDVAASSSSLSRSASGAGSPGGGEGSRLRRQPTPGTLSRMSEAGSTPRGETPARPELPVISEAPSASGAPGGARCIPARNTSSSARPGQPPMDLAQMMQMMAGALGGAGGPGAAAAAAGGGQGAAGGSAEGAASGGAAPAAATTTVAAAAAPRAGAGGPGAGAAAGGGDLQPLMQLMGGLMGGIGGGAGGGGGGMGGLLQMAGQIATDPSMQPLLNNLASTVLGGGGGAGGSPLGSLLSGLLGGPAPGGSRGSGRPSATISSLDLLDTVLPPQQAEEWRRVIEADEMVQQQQAPVLAAPLSEVYLAGAPVVRQGLLSQLEEAGQH